MWHGGIATWKVFARPESFCAYLGNPQLKDMPKAQISRWCGKCQDGLESLRMVWKVSKWTGKFPYGLENFRMVWKLSGWSGKFLDGLESFWMVWKLSGWSGSFPNALTTFQIDMTPESEKHMSHGGIATRKVFARPESFCALLPNPPLKDMPKCTDF